MVIKNSKDFKEEEENEEEEEEEEAGGVLSSFLIKFIGSH